MTEKPKFTRRDAYKAIFEATKHTMAFMECSPDELGDRIDTHRCWPVDGEIDFAALAEHINATIAEAVKAEREACAEIAKTLPGLEIRHHPQAVFAGQAIAAQIHARGVG